MDTERLPRTGSLVCVGLGITLGAHLAPRARHHIESADVVFVAASDAVVEEWIRQLRPDARSLQPFYREGKSRYATYREMVAAMLAEVRRGRKVCGAFYGHPGVFAKVPHDAAVQARAEGFEAALEPGISAEDCLYADLGIDPGRVGCQHYEASQLLFYRRRIDPSAYLVIWQIGVVGDLASSRFATDAAHRGLLIEKLLRDYPPGHEVIIYEAPTLPLMEPRATWLPLDRLADAELHMHSTVVVPPCEALRRDDEMFDRASRLGTAVPRPRRGRPCLTLVQSRIPTSGEA